MQGEGNGHLTQSIALGEILESNGHEIISVFRGKSLFKKNSTNTSNSFFSPSFISSKNKRGINLFITFIINAICIPLYIYESIRLAIIIRKLKPDAVINFYDLIGGISFMLISSSIRKYVISHHFFFEHPDFKWPEDRKFEKSLLLFHSWITSFAADKKLALSFNFALNIQEKKLFIIPPLLRKKILNAIPVNSGHIHIYTLDHGYVDEIQEWCRQNPGFQVNMFSNFIDIPNTDQSNLRLFSFNEEANIDSLKSCSRVICTSGFETPAEAIFLNKPVEVFPMDHHFEQYCNALDLERSGFGKRTKKLISNDKLFSVNEVENGIYWQWVKDADKLVLSHLCPQY